MYIRCQNDHDDDQQSCKCRKNFDAKESVINIQTIPMINGITTIPELILAPQMDIPPNEEKKLDDTITSVIR